MNARLALTFAFSILCMIGRPTDTEACSCGGRAASPDAVKRATAVFAGTVEDVIGQSGSRRVVATFAISKVYKGRLSDRVVIEGNGTSCDVQFTKNLTYIVYAQEHDGRLTTHFCTRTRELEMGAEDVRYLDNLAAGRPQAVLHGHVRRRVTDAAGSPARQALFERLEVVAVSSQGRRSIRTDEWGPYQIVLPPGDVEVWVERAGQRVTTPAKIRLRSGDEKELWLTAAY